MRRLFGLHAQGTRAVLLASLACCALASAGLAPSASAGTITVTNLNDAGAGSLRQAILDAAVAETIVVPAGQITLTSGPLAVAKNLTITGAGSGATVISGNDASRVFTITGTPTVTLSGLTVTHGKDPMGAGINAVGTLTLEDVAVSGNHAGGGGTAGFGGGIDFSAAGTLSLIDSVVSENTAGGGAGGAGFGGGIEYEPSANAQAFALSLTRSGVSGNRAGVGDAGFGGGINASSGFDSGSISIALTDSALSGNVAGGGGAEAPGFGGGLELSSGGAKNALTLALDRTAITGNTAGGGNTESSGFGGGIEFSSGGTAVTQTLTIANSTLSANTAGGTGASGFGGGVDFGSGTATLSYVTVAANSAGGGGGTPFGGGLNLGAVGAGGVGNSIVAANSGGNCASAVISTGHNIDDGASCGFKATGDNSGVDAKLGPLGDHGGISPTQMPLAGSPAIDAGASAACASTDQRGVARPQAGGCDAGAVEVAPPAVTTSSVSSVGSESATVGGSVNPNFSATSYHVDFGTTSAYGSFTASASAGEGGVGQAVSAVLSKLKPQTLYHFRVVASNAAGTLVGGDQTLTTSKAPVAVPFPKGRPKVPTLSSVRLTNKRFRVGKKSTAISARRAPIGTSFRFRLAAAAKVQITITRSARGLRRGRGCVAPTTRLRRAHAKSCTRTLTVGTLTRANMRTGANAIAFSGRVGRRALAPRPYRAVLRASNAGGRSKPVALVFIVVR